ncbi:hypothetical protein [Jeotgalibacillus sp. R-1-5s-1]|uniref:hypothetical protein n=1 Tax=Jeotgalibacillus sp. R-1-5s-1 TaxID=2555897 RepID=UPI00106931A3|nr:hypothetical protein [Jeotgalibacillus sp. R-1-5s-1]TFD99674.1 hypothetical protein E2491_07195 [Jeotgalibacillus sp. R-1-5s-1]
MKIVIRFFLYAMIYFIFALVWDLLLADSIKWTVNLIQAALFSLLFTMLLWNFELKKRRKEKQS